MQYSTIVKRKQWHFRALGILFFQCLNIGQLDVPYQGRHVLMIFRFLLTNSFNSNYTPSCEKNLSSLLSSSFTLCIKNVSIDPETICISLPFPQQISIKKHRCENFQLRSLTLSVHGSEWLLFKE